MAKLDSYLAECADIHSCEHFARPYSGRACYSNRLLCTV